MPGRKYPEKMTQLLVDIFSDANGTGDFFAQQFAVARTQSGKVAAKCIDRDIELAGDLFVTRQAYAASEKWFQCMKQASFGGILEFVLGSGQCGAARAAAQACSYCCSSSNFIAGGTCL